MTNMTKEKAEVKESLRSELSKATGVGVGDVEKILDHLGLDTKLSELNSHVAKDQFKAVKATDLKIAVKIGKEIVAV